MLQWCKRTLRTRKKARYVYNVYNVYQYIYIYICIVYIYRDTTFFTKHLECVYSAFSFFFSIVSLVKHTMQGNQRRRKIKRARKKRRRRNGNMIRRICRRLQQQRWQNARGSQKPKPRLSHPWMMARVWRNRRKSSQWNGLQ